MKSSRGRKVVIAVGMFDSVHFARWLKIFRDQPLDFLLFPSSPNRRTNAQLRSLVNGTSNASYQYAYGLSNVLGLPMWIIDRVLNNGLRGFLLRVLIERHRPDYVHALEMQNAGYVLLRALGKSDGGRKPHIILTNYGSDIFWFSRFESHRNKIRNLLTLTDTYACECHRDVELAQNLGYRGRVMPVLPNAGGFEKAELECASSVPARRSTIAVKGYQGWAGRAAVALEALELVAPQVREYDIEIYSCNAITLRLARRLSRRTGLKISAYRKGALTHTEMLSMFRRSIAYIGISESDGISTSMLEAMAFGAIPVQTATACCSEWFTNTGVRVDTISSEAVAEAILAALELAKDPTNAEKNSQTIKQRASEEKVREAALQYYR